MENIKERLKEMKGRIEFPEIMNRDTEGKNVERNDTWNLRFRNHNELSIIQKIKNNKFI